MSVKLHKVPYERWEIVEAPVRCAGAQETWYDASGQPISEYRYYFSCPLTECNRFGETVVPAGLTGTQLQNHYYSWARRLVGDRIEETDPDHWYDFREFTGKIKNPYKYTIMEFKKAMYYGRDEIRFCCGKEQMRLLLEYHERGETPSFVFGVTFYQKGVQKVRFYRLYNLKSIKRVIKRQRVKRVTS